MVVMVQPRRFSDAELVEWVRQDRKDFGACTTGTLARRSGHSRAALNERIHALVRAGRLQRSQVPGSLRPARPQAKAS
jgi:hypothetical protein